MTAWFLLSLNYGSFVLIICNFTQSTKALDFLAEEQRKRSWEPENADEDTERSSLNQPPNSFWTSRQECVDTVPNNAQRMRTSGPHRPRLAGTRRDLNGPPGSYWHWTHNPQEADQNLEPKSPGGLPSIKTKESGITMFHHRICTRCTGSQPTTIQTHSHMYNPQSMTPKQHR